ncbi:hypothetical protein RMSM_05613 [Rhodopirellula maiorica SM1]|uniref:Uncharacterized protein n=1 Tax=Rhodopirellula maiorica SM1 TaxID=1265738 RepID=M5RDK9_9BACT|nr:hypothetical protein RMSM_05613 [Rhodopirellula maiorica SM1]
MKFITLNAMDAAGRLRLKSRCGLCRASRHAHRQKTPLTVIET